MKDSRAEKLKADLNRVEAELLKSLIECLPTVANDGSWLFENSEYCHTSIQFMLHRVPARNAELLQLANQSLALRRELVLPTENTPAALFLAACAESASDNEHRRGPRKLAEWVLSNLEAKKKE